MDGTATQPRVRTRAVRAIEEVDDAPASFDATRAARLKEREADFEARRLALEAGEPIVRMVREPGYFGHYVGLHAATMAKGGDCRIETLRAAEPMVRSVIASMFEYDRKRYAALHGIQSISLPVVDLMEVGRQALVAHTVTHLRAASKENWTGGAGDQNEKVTRLTAEVESRVMDAIGMRVEIEIDYDRVAHRLGLERARTLRPNAVNIDTKA